MLLSVAAMALLFAIVAHGQLIPGELSGHGSGSNAMTRDHPEVRLGGFAAGLYPGGAKALWVHVDNWSRHPRIVRSVWAVAGNARSRCLARNIKIGTRRGRFRIPPGGRRWVALKIAMRPSAANACQGAVFPLRFWAE